MKRSLILLIGLSIVLMSCAGSSSGQNRGGEPAWVLNPGKSYSESEFMMAVGTGDSRRDAESSAFGNLARIFKAEIRSDQTIINEFIETQGTGNDGLSQSTQMISAVRIGSNQDIINSKVMDTWVGKTGRYHVLVGLNRQETARIYAREIGNNDERVSSYENTASTSNNVIHQLSWYRKALILAKVNDMLKQQQAVLLDGGNVDSEQNQTVIRLERSVQQARIRCPVFFDIADNLPGIIETNAGEAFEAEGFVITKNSRDAILHVKIEFSTSRSELRRDDAEFVRWQFSVEMKDITTGQTFNTWSKEDRSGALSLRDAKMRAAASAGKLLMNEFRSFMKQQLFSTN